VLARPPVPPLTGLVLAGGASVRMGADKAWLTVGDRPLIHRAVDVLGEICVEVLVASGSSRRLAGVTARQVADAVQNSGPLGGILAGLQASPTPLMAVVAVDMPFASTAVLALLVELAVTSTAAVVAPVADGRLQPLHAVWAVRGAPALQRRLRNGQRSVTAAAEAVGVYRVPERLWRPADPTGRFARNVNRPDDLLLD
jgi:molybdopterin-guanine dinucleotide biosynthesis protein A